MKEITHTFFPSSSSTAKASAKQRHYLNPTDDDDDGFTFPMDDTSRHKNNIYGRNLYEQQHRNDAPTVRPGFGRDRSASSSHRSTPVSTKFSSFSDLDEDEEGDEIGNQGSSHTSRVGTHETNANSKNLPNHNYEEYYRPSSDRSTKQQSNSANYKSVGITMRLDNLRQQHPQQQQMQYGEGNWVEGDSYVYNGYSAFGTVRIDFDDEDLYALAPLSAPSRRSVPPALEWTLQSPMLALVPSFDDATPQHRNEMSLRSSMYTFNTYDDDALMSTLFTVTFPRHAASALAPASSFLTSSSHSSSSVQAFDSSAVGIYVMDRADAPYFALCCRDQQNLHRLPVDELQDGDAAISNTNAQQIYRHNNDIMVWDCVFIHERITHNVAADTHRFITLRGLSFPPLRAMLVAGPTDTSSLLTSDIRPLSSDSDAAYRSYGRSHASQHYRTPYRRPVLLTSSVAIHPVGLLSTATKYVGNLETASAGHSDLRALSVSSHLLHAGVTNTRAVDSAKILSPVSLLSLSSSTSDNQGRSKKIFSSSSASAAAITHVRHSMYVLAFLLLATTAVVAVLKKARKQPSFKNKKEKR